MSEPAAGSRDSTDTNSVVRLAHDALSRGQAFLAAGQIAEAIRWLDRACRLAPADRTLTLALATASLGADPANAAALFRQVTNIEDVREAWLGLAAAQMRLGNAVAAADALAQALHRHAPDAGLVKGTLADTIVRAAGAPGWCGLSGDGAVVLRAGQSSGVRIALDGTPCRGTQLPRGWERARWLTVEADGRPLLGSPVDINAIRRCAGFVEAQDGGLRGWAWHPGDRDRAPVLLIGPANRPNALRIVPDKVVDGLQWGGALARPRGFTVSAARLAGFNGLVHVRDEDGRDLLGSPLNPRWEQQASAAAAGMLARLYPAGKRHSATVQPFPPPALPADIAGARRDPSRADAKTVDVVIPVHNGREQVLACLESVLATVQTPSRITVVDDGSSDAALIAALTSLARTRRIRLLRHERNLGFPAAANAGIMACPGRDVVLLNSDTLVPPGWLERLRAAVRSAPDIGTATPFSNNATILSYPAAADRNDTPGLAETIALDRLAQRANPGTAIDIPVGVGFCLYLRRTCLDETGLLRADMFAQGYGEENDFCLRARHLGWRHVAVPGVFVAHCGGASFGSAGHHLRLRNERLLNRLHPGYAALIQDFAARDPLAAARRTLDLQRWEARRRRGGRAAILVTHAEGGGVERQVAEASANHAEAGLRPIVLRPSRLANGTPAVAVAEGAANDFPNLRFAMPDEMPGLLRLLRRERPQLAEVHHLLGHAPAIHDVIASLAVPYTVHVHDYAWFCPRVSLVGGDRRYCGEPDVARCEICVADAGSFLDEDISVRDLRDRSDAFLDAATRVVAPSADVATRMRRHFPALRADVVPHETDRDIDAPPPSAARSGVCRVCVPGAIGLHKGYDIVLACARDAAERKLPLEFNIVGHTTDDARLLATGRVFVTGEYRQDEAVKLIRAQRATIGLLPSIWPETWSLSLTELWRAGLRVAAFDFGTPAERIRQSGWGVLLPLGLSPGGINNVLVAAAGLTVHEGG